MGNRAEQDLAMIRRLMEEGRRAVVDRGVHFMIWGIVPAIGLSGTYLRAVRGIGPEPRWTWVVLLVIGWAASLVYGWRAGRRARVSTLARRLLSALWIAAGMSLTLIGVAGMFGGLVDVRALPGLLGVVLAAPIMVSSVLTGERWLAWVAAGWWIGGGVMLFVPGLYTLLLMAVMAVALMAVPGAVLYARSRASRGTDRVGELA